MIGEGQANRRVVENEVREVMESDSIGPKGASRDFGFYSE